MENRIVSVIIPTYNRANYLNDALSSIYRQDYRPLEVIVVDDGSTDETERVVYKWSKDHTEYGFTISYFYQENQGAPSTRNKGLEVAHGEFIKFLDSDDILHENCIRRQISFTKRLEENQIVFGDLGSFKNNKYINNQYYTSPSNEEDSFEYLLKNIVGTPTPLHKSILLERVNGFKKDIEKGQEYDLHLRLAMLGVEFIYEKGVVAYKREEDRNETITNKNSVMNNPEAHIFIQDNRRKLALDYYNGKLPEDIANELARGYWMVGRQMTRARYYEKAQCCFRKSKELAIGSNGHMLGSIPYKWLAKSTNPIFAEKSFTSIKKFIGR